LLFWFILFSTVNGTFMQRFGGHMLYLYPEYLDKVSALSFALVGVSIGIFVLSWNITTFILHSKHLKFLATTTQPFLKYCINNGILPLAFLIFYFIKALAFNRGQELLPAFKILMLAGGFMFGFITSLSIGLFYFFGADKTIYRLMPISIKEELQRHKNRYEKINARKERGIMRVHWYLSATMKLRRPRSVRHYTSAFIEGIFKQHHLAALFSILMAFLSLIFIGYFLDNIYFQIPAAASITVFFAILIAVAGAFSYFLQSWAIPAVIISLLGINYLYKQNILDPRNKAYGIDYASKDSMPEYNRDALIALASPYNQQKDSLRFINALNTWKKRQSDEKPVFIIVCASGGGSRAASFTLDVLQNLDSMTNGKLMSLSFLFSGASGGMIGAAWYRELYVRKLQGQLKNPNQEAYANDISGDLLNPLFTSFVARDLLAPPQRFTYKNQQYIKDRGYAFEQKLSENTHGWLNKSLQDYRQLEDSALIPRVLINTVITRDGRKMIIGTRPARFLMQPFVNPANDRLSDPDAVDFMSYFHRQQPGNLGMLSALRMNATFPYVLPNVWLPTKPVIDVMDAGFRDNTGVESGTRFLFYFRQWLKENTSKVVMIQIRDKIQGGWESPYVSDNFLDFMVRPALLTQNNLFQFQEYAQLRELEWFHALYGDGFNRVVFEYQPINKDAAATLSFHLTQREKKDLKASIRRPENAKAFERVISIIENRLLEDSLR
jgi:hypothetical protein